MELIRVLNQIDTKISDFTPGNHVRHNNDGNISSYEIALPDTQTTPIIFASPHSGCYYPTSFISSSRLDPLMLRGSEDSFVDELFIQAPEFGAPLLAANFPRAYLDCNRQPYELDPAMFVDKLPNYVTTNSTKIAAGLGTIPKVVKNGEEIYRHKLTFSEAKRRIDKLYFPYHCALRDLVKTTQKQFGICVLIDCHSMPYSDELAKFEQSIGTVDCVLGNNNGASCSPQLLSYIKNSLENNGLITQNNYPYSGGFTTCHYGNPNAGIHSLQIEINRNLYMKENIIEKHSGFEILYKVITTFIEDLSNFKLN